ncbi:MAG: mersacidin/lichenicidin family type 2 lantibiotic [Acidobacteriota bacterium]|nr:mersacidin/lichenicidin family type 2 lantibiotic [Acidobacteriota bacterium]
MSKVDIIRAWRDEEYRNSLSADQRNELPGNPAGIVALENDGLNIVGGLPSEYRTLYTARCDSVCVVFSC